MSDLSRDATEVSDEAAMSPVWWPGVEIVPEARPGVIANLAILAEHSEAVRAALADTQA